LNLDDFIFEHCDLHSVWAVLEAQLAFINIRYRAGDASHFVNGAMYFQWGNNQYACHYSMRPDFRHTLYHWFDYHNGYSGSSD